MTDQSDELQDVTQELLIALKIARKYVVDIDAYLSKYEPHNRMTYSDLSTIEAAIEKAENRYITRKI